MLITVTGTIGAGKSSLTKLLSNYLGSDAFYESVDDNPILPLFYTATEEEIQANRYPFLLQLHFLNTRFKSIKEAMVHRNNVLDRHIEEDLYFAKVNHELGRISDLEFSLYESLLENMMEEMSELGCKSADLVIHLKISFDGMMNRINKRSRDFEQDKSLVDYYYKIWEGYDEFVFKKFAGKPLVVIDMDKYDIVGNEEHKKEVIDIIMKEISSTRERDVNEVEEIIYGNIRYRKYYTSSRCITWAGEDGSLLKEFKNEIRVSKGHLNTHGYMSTRVGRRTINVHTIIAEMFLNKPNGIVQVNHIDGDKTNNCISNLEWVSPSENVKHAWGKGLAKKSEYSRKVTSEMMKGSKNYFYGSNRVGSINPNSKQCVAVIDGEVIEKGSIVEVLDVMKCKFPSASRNWITRVPLKFRDRITFFGTKSDYILYKRKKDWLHKD